MLKTFQDNINSYNFDYIGIDIVFAQDNINTYNLSVLIFLLQTQGALYNSNIAVAFLTLACPLDAATRSTNDFEPAKLLATLQLGDTEPLSTHSIH